MDYSAIHARVRETFLPCTDLPLTAFAELITRLIVKAVAAPDSAVELPLTAENVEGVLDEIRRSLIADGGNVVLHEIDGNVVRLKLQGPCGSCSSFVTTVKRWQCCEVEATRTVWLLFKFCNDCENMAMLRGRSYKDHVAPVSLRSFCLFCIWAYAPIHGSFTKLSSNLTPLCMYKSETCAEGRVRIPVVARAHEFLEQGKTIWDTLVRFRADSVRYTTFTFICFLTEAAAQAGFCSLQYHLLLFLLIISGFMPRITQKYGMPLDLDEYSDTNLRNMEDLSSSNRAGVSYSATRPAKHPTIKFIDSSA
ncbi:hypothetical protein RHSIM_Rhsim13G0040200 [Rhododendron simsii]|uniref:NIF system FeS cluster assembly NifU C-terminal domain-containing protein n=1 Tax=Rhododendron simsii TaxID=118357 RepID=A0A834L593_RHOSS|nr:hypothetical protein RHSIM_Rhsim13G0040200 [Rhododendron simsii]